MSDKPDLSRMSLKDMEALATVIDAAVDAGGALSVSGLEPTFVVCPGQEIVIRTGYAMPGMGRGLWLADNPPVTGFPPRPLFPSAAPVQTPPHGEGEARPGGLPVAARQSRTPEAQAEGMAESPAEVGVAAPAAVGHPDPQPEAAPVARAGETVAAAEPAPVPETGDATGGDCTPAAGGPIAEAEPPAPVPGSASALVASTQAAGWTAEEDATAVRVAAAAIHAGRSKSAAYAEAAAALGRPVPGTTFRLTHKLRDALGDAVLDLASPDFPPSPPAPVQKAAVEPAPAVHAVAAGADAEAPALDPLQAHLTSLKPSAVWKPARDLALLQLAIDGWKPHEIAEDLGVVVAEVNKRFDLLTDSDRETKQRRFKREDVLRALQAMHATGDA